jgi:acetyl-CoA carboxylase biotin carboxyl carrier protein
MDYDKIKRLIAIVEQNRLAELAVEEEGLSVTIKAEAPEKHVPTVGTAQPGLHVEVEEAPMLEIEEAPMEEIAAENLAEIRSLMIGVFYRCPSPDSPPYIEVGDEIEVGQTIGLIEAMKVFSEVPSEVAGRVVAVPAESGKLVQQGDVLVVVETAG